MKILLLDTCGALASIALADTEALPQIVAMETLPARTASERLLSTIARLTAEHGTGIRDIEAVAVVHGPGSFTGVRIGVSTAKGLCEALGIPVIAISRLAVLACAAAAPCLDEGADRRVFTLLSAGRGELYLGEYCGQVCLREALLREPEVAALLGRETGADTAVAYERSVAESLSACRIRLLAEPTAASALPLALLRIGQSAFDNVAELDANYLRRTDLEIKARLNSAGFAADTVNR